MCFIRGELAVDDVRIWIALSCWTGIGAGGCYFGALSFGAVSVDMIYSSFA